MRRWVGEEIKDLLNNSPTFLLLFALFPYISIYVNGVNPPNEFLFLKEHHAEDIKIISKSDFFTITALASGDIQISIPGNVIL